MRKVLLILLIFFLAGTRLYAFEGMQLHEEADKLGLKAAQAAVEADPASIERLYLLGLVYLNLHKDKDAQEIFEKILSMQPQDLKAKWGRAEALRRRHRVEESEELLKQIIESEEDFSPAYISLAYIKYLKMDFTGSVKLAKQVLEQGRENVDLSNYARAYLLVAGGKGMLAHYGGPLAKVFNGMAVLPNLKKAERLQPESPAVLFGLGSFYFLAPKIAGGDVERAQVYLERAIRIDPQFADAFVRLSQVYRVKGDEEKADALLEKAIQMDPGNTIALDAKNRQCKFICISLEE